MRTGTTRRFWETVLLAIVLLFVLGPFFWMVLLSFQGFREVSADVALLLPNHFHLENFLTVLRNSYWLEGMKNSFLISLASTVINVTLSVPFAYAISRLEFPGKNWMHRTLLVLIFTPMMLFFLPVRNMFVHFGLENTIWATALPTAAQVFPALTLARFFGSFPSELDDYAALQGLSPLQTLLRMYLPLSGRHILYAAILSFTTVWNCSYLPMFMYHGPGGLVVVQQAMLHFAVHPDSIQIAMAAVIITCLPCWVLSMSQYRFVKTIQISVIDPYKK